MEALADAEETVFIAAGNPKQFELLRGFRGCRNELCRSFRIWRGRETADPRKSFEMTQPEIQALTATHREARQCAVFAIWLRGIVRLDEWNHILEQCELVEVRDSDVQRLIPKETCRKSKGH